MTSTTTPLTPPVPAPLELDRREGDGLTVRLLWRPAANEILVRVHDTRTGDRFDVPVPDHAQAREVFTHPYGYAPVAR